MYKMRNIIVYHIANPIGDPVREFPPEPGYIDGPAGIWNS